MPADPSDVPPAPTDDLVPPVPPVPPAERPSPRDGAAPLGTWSVAALGALAAAGAWLLAAGLLWAYSDGLVPARLAVRLTPALLPMPLGPRPGPVALSTVVVAVVGALVTAGLALAVRRGTVSATAVLLSGWFVACLAGVAGAAVTTVEIGAQLGAVVTWRWIVSQGATWGVVWGWAVGVVLLLALRRGAAVRSSGARPSSVVAAVVAGLVAATGWAASGWVLERVMTEVGTRTAARQQVTEWALTLLPNSAGPDLAWFGPPYVRAYLLGAALLGVVVAVAVVLAARGTAPVRGGGVLVLVAWWASVVGGMVATVVAAAQAGSHLQGTEGGDPFGLLSLYVGSSAWQASGWGLMYGWVVGLVAWVLLRVVNRTSTDAPAGGPPAPEVEVPATASV
ncbi:hypothetical protein Cch01nite_22790 [Cellulomonas chitinilytica]|uniref:Uncharacterized protein n=1 Tax=Cellulomonas chitinilytica TaxID=398759 RepID=A0A919P3G1_9CELL|nr:hypothetical protein [Cellulomonas chitinilytica]GIG21555.1 hypothetical protein Cch01nite_22790 [Cellulomonas chitinilytica]